MVYDENYLWCLSTVYVLHVRLFRGYEGCSKKCFPYFYNLAHKQQRGLPLGGKIYLVVVAALYDSQGRATSLRALPYTP